MRKWYKDDTKIWNGGVTIYYDAIEYERNRIILFAHDEILAELGEGEELVEVDKNECH